MKKIIALFIIIFCLNVSGETKIYNNIDNVISLFNKYKSCSFIYDLENQCTIYFFDNCNIKIIIKDKK